MTRPRRWRASRRSGPAGSTWGKAPTSRGWCWRIPRGTSSASSGRSPPRSWPSRPVARYALLLRASANRVFGESAYGLAQAELAAFDQRLLAGWGARLERATIGGVEYLVADTTRALDDATLAALSNLSSLHAVFEVEGDDRFRPVPVAP